VIRSATLADAHVIESIYNWYIESTIVTFEEERVVAADISERIDKVLKGSLPWLVLEQANEIVGYAYATPWRARRAYRFCVETSIYLARDWAGQGFGTELYEHLLAQLTERNMHVAIGGIALPNGASVRLHEKLGFRKVAHFEQVGFKFGSWIDVGYWQKALV
jgi:L-amino acid N-acyltransferase YncA